VSQPGLLFDLDGTLADTAPDLVAVLNRLLVAGGRAPFPFAIARNHVSHGAAGLIRLGFGLAPNEPINESLRQEFLETYASHGHSNSRLFITLESLTTVVSTCRAAWGIVTNKPAALTASLLDRLGLGGLAGTVVSGDTLAQRKPHPAPLLHAARELGIDPANCIYLGDAERDIEAGRAAGMRTVATSYGYIRPGEDFTRWYADAHVDHPRKICATLREMTGSR
jgi:phosphoglycolate phosphatase